MEWITDVSVLKNEEQVLGCFDVENEVYEVMIYLKTNPNKEDILFDCEGFYYFCADNDIWYRSCMKLKCFTKIKKPEL